MKDISSILRALGLADSDVTTYMNTLQHGPSTVVDLSKRTNLSRQAVYLSIDAMTERGLMSSIQRGKKRYFTAEPPTKLLAHAKRQAQKVEEHIADLEKAIPHLELQIGGEKPVVRLYEGKEAVRAHLEDAQKHHVKHIDEMSDLEALGDAFSKEDLDSLRKHVAKQNTSMRRLYTVPTTGAKGNMKYLPKSMNGFKANIAVYGNNISFTTFANKAFNVIIEDKQIALAMKHLFELAEEGMKKR
ncbi:MAG: helix-turn-helix domain-containing protein [Patescibacteria group bacterium]